MATKTISITEDAYERLASLRKGNESFSEIISKITRKPKLSDYFGILSKEAGEELERNVKIARARNRKASRERAERIRKALS